MKRSLASLAAVLALATASSALAQATPDFGKVQIKATQLAPDFWTLEGQGGTISVLAGSDGILLVDSQFAPLTDKLVAAIRQFSDKPIRFLVDTHVHPDHVGGNANFARLGATIFARDQLRWRLEHPNAAADGRAVIRRHGLALVSSSTSCAAVSFERSGIFDALKSFGATRQMRPRPRLSRFSCFLMSSGSDSGVSITSR